MPLEYYLIIKLATVNLATASTGKHFQSDQKINSISNMKIVTESECAKLFKLMIIQVEYKS